LSSATVPTFPSYQQLVHMVIHKCGCEVETLMLFLVQHKMNREIGRRWSWVRAGESGTYDRHDLWVPARGLRWVCAGLWSIGWDRGCRAKNELPTRFDRPEGQVVT